MPFAKIGGQFIAMKGAAGQEELTEAQNGIQKLGGELILADEYTLYTSDAEEKRVMVQISKKVATPREFPRAFGAIKKKPLYYNVPRETSQFRVDFLFHVKHEMSM